MSGMKNSLIKLMALFVTMVLSQQGFANIALGKHRIFFDANQRTEALQFRNTTGVTISFSADLALTAMTEEGTVYNVDSDPLSALKMIRFSPKRGTIPPGGRQVIRFSVRKPAGLEDGEYRAALLLNGAPINDDDKTRVTVQPSLTFSIPIIVRNGRTNATTELQNPKYSLVNDKPSIQLWQTLEGNRSLFGNFTILDEDGEEIGVLNRAAVYRPLNGRNISIPLSKPITGNATIQYQEIEKFGGSLSAQTEISIK